MQIFIRIDGSAGEVKPLLVREALLRDAALQSLKSTAEIVAAKTALSLPTDANSNDVLVLVSDDKNWQTETVEQFKGIIKRYDFDTLLADPNAILASVSNGGESASIAQSGVKKIVAITSCPTGIAHTFMAAEGLTESAKALGYDIRVETQGSVGAGTPLTAKEIAEADLVIIAADREVDRSRFAGKPLFASGTNPAINDGQALIQKAFKQAKTQGGEKADNVEDDEKASGAAAVYKHLMTGISFMLPFVVAGGLLVAISFAIGGVGVTEAVGTFGYTINQIGGTGLGLMVPILAGFIAYSIADRPGIAPGVIGGMLALTLKAGFLGGIFAGFIAGYAVLLCIKYIKLPKSLQGLMPVFILPLIGTFITGVLMYYVIGTPTAWLFNHLVVWVGDLAKSGSGAFLLGLLLGGMMAVDLGGPVNKAAYFIGTSFIVEGQFGPMAAVMIGGMTPPMALALACRLFPSRFTKEESSTKLTTFILGLSFISEGAIPFAARDPLRVIPSLVIGSALAGGVAVGLGTGLQAPHGGIFAILIPEVVKNIQFPGYLSGIGIVLIALAVGTIVSAVIVGLLKKRVEAPSAA